MFQDAFLARNSLNPTNQIYYLVCGSAFCSCRSVFISVATFTSSLIASARFYSASSWPPVGRVTLIGN